MRAVGYRQAWQALVDPRLVDELARLRRRLPVTKRGAAIDLTKEQLTGIGQAVGDYLLGAMREQKS